jgi:hypothetical protein
MGQHVAVVSPGPSSQGIKDINHAQLLQFKQKANHAAAAATEAAAAAADHPSHKAAAAAKKQEPTTTKVGIDGNWNIAIHRVIACKMPNGCICCCSKAESLQSSTLADMLVLRGLVVTM